MTADPIYPRRWAKGMLCGMILGVAVSILPFHLWAKYKPVTAALWPSYARVYYDKSLPHMPSRSGQVRTVTLSFGVGPVTVIPSIAKQQFLRRMDGQTPIDLIRWPLAASGLLMLLGMLAGAKNDRAHKARSQYGVQLEGPELCTRAQFNRALKGKGLGFYIKNRRTFFEFLKGREGHLLRMPQETEMQGRLFMGDTGVGKTSLHFQVMDQAEERGEACVVYDPHQQFTSRYFDAARGDVILNPYDDRCPYYHPLSELNLGNMDEAWTVAMSQGMSQWADSPGGNKEHGWFFNATSRKLWQHLLVNFQPSLDELVSWMRNETEILMRVVGTELETMVPRTSPDQRAAVLSTFTMIADALDQLPRKEEGRQEWSIREWSKTRNGWIFLTGDMLTRESLRTFHTLILDQIITRIGSMGAYPDLPPVHMVIDEAQSLQRLPQLITLLSELRKFGLAPTIAFQGRSQMKTLYGDLAEAIFSMPLTKFFFRSGDESAASWAERMIGKIRVLQVRESRPTHTWRNRSGGTYTDHETEKPLVPAANIAKLKNLHGYMKYGDSGRVVKFELLTPPEYFAKFGNGREEPVFIPRPAKPVMRQEVSRKTEQLVRDAMNKRKDMAPTDAEVPQPGFGSGALVEADFEEYSEE